MMSRLLFIKIKKASIPDIDYKKHFSYQSSDKNKIKNIPVHKVKKE